MYSDFRFPFRKLSFLFPVEAMISEVYVFPTPKLRKYFRCPKVYGFYVIICYHRRVKNFATYRRVCGGKKEKLLTTWKRTMWTKLGGLKCVLFMCFKKGKSISNFFWYHSASIVYVRRWFWYWRQWFAYSCILYHFPKMMATFLWHDQILFFFHEIR